MPSTIITIDGPAGSGKSTVAHQLASRLGFELLDTGAMYRAVAWSALQAGIPPESARDLGTLAAQLQLRMHDRHVWINEIDVTSHLRTPEVSQMASIVASVPAVREALVAQQRQVATGRRVVSEGRDQGTVVFPDATCKFFLTASPVVRAHRRYSELAAVGQDIDFETLLAQQQARDHRDQTRACAPLLKAEDAIEIDTSHLALDDVISQIEQLVRRAINF